MRSRARTKALRGRGSSCPICRRRCIDCRRAGAQTDDPARREEMLIKVVPRSRRQVYKMRAIVEAVFDKGSFFEIGRQHGRSSITGLARLDGWPVAVLASDPYVYGGAWTAESSLKVTRFVDFAETFHLPVVHLVDIPGFRIGLEAEQAATIRHGARAMTAIYQAKGPWCTILIRKAFGVAGAAMQQRERACRSAMRGRRAIGGRCRSRAGSRPPTGAILRRRRTR